MSTLPDPVASMTLCNDADTIAAAIDDPETSASAHNPKTRSLLALVEQLRCVVDPGPDPAFTMNLRSQLVDRAETHLVDGARTAFLASPASRCSYRRK